MGRHTKGTDGRSEDSGRSGVYGQRWGNALQKSAQNREYWADDMRRSMWETMMGYEQKKTFRPGELTTRQASEIYGLSMATITNYCKRGYIPDAWHDDVHKHWHIPAVSMDKINKAITEHGLSWTARHWIAYYGKQLKNGSNGHT